VTQPPYTDFEIPPYDPELAAIETWDALIDSGAFLIGRHVLASGDTASLKIDAGLLSKHPEHYRTVLGHLAAHPYMQEADLAMYVAKGMREPMEAIASKLRIPIAHTVKVEDGPRYTFAFASEDDREKAQKAERPTIGEDIVSSGGSIGGTGGLLLPHQRARCVAMLLRGTENPDHLKGMEVAYLAQRYVPTDAVEFLEQLQAEN
jgi:hypothetical protein